MRVALTGQAASPGIFDVLRHLGRNLSLDRIDGALATLAEGAEDPPPPNPTTPASGDSSTPAAASGDGGR